MAKVRVNKKEYEYLETFRNKKNLALLNIARYGWIKTLRDGKEDPNYDDELTWAEVIDNGEAKDSVKYRLIRAVLDGYELYEPFYTVRIPDPNGTYKYRFLKKDENSKIYIASYDYLDWMEWDVCKLTEEEIKEDFAWAWQLAEPVSGGDDE